MSDSQANRPAPASSVEAEVTQPLAPLDSAAALVRVLDEYLVDLKAGAAPDRAKLLADHPELAAQLKQCLAGIEFIHRAARPASSPTQLGDFRIVRELGRGGMGVVYEAEQVSLRRRVALKVLRFGAVADQEAIERFRREAETVAHLHHTNIVPIFAVGAEQGVSYYAMQYIEGGSLADKVASAELQPFAFQEIARWGLEAAEALAHAHQRGVIHRDIKPSNLLLDADGRVWLTDFGLARRADEVTLTMSGMLMGTPRYMSPEQATTALKQPIDHRTDIYSLGATLYELATGQPVFAADTPHGVISQILTVEPRRPRTLRPAIPRDLETLILKCLAKEPAERYATAQALADDLRASREGRAIRARRAGLPEQTVRWVQKRKKSIGIAAAAAAATLLIAVVGFAVFSSLAAARLASVMMRTDGPHLKVEVLDETEQTAVATFTAPTQEPQKIPPGRYHVRLSADGHLSETSIFAAAKGTSYDLTVALSPRNLWEIPVQDGELSELAHIGDHDDLFLAANEQLRRVDGATGQNVWQISLAGKDQPLVAKVQAKDGSHAQIFGPINSISFDYSAPNLARPLVDLDGDGIPDLIWASRATASLLAVSGKSGKLLWCHRNRPTPPAGLDERTVQRFFVGETIVGEPQSAVVDGRQVVVALNYVQVAQYLTTKPKFVNTPPQLWLEAVAADTGDMLWRRMLTAPNESPAQTLYTAAVSNSSGRAIGAIAYGNRLFGFDFLTGASPWPDRQLDAGSPIVMRFADLAGNGQLDVLLVREVVTKVPDSPQQGNLNAPPRRELTVVAISPTSPTPLWEWPLADVQLPSAVNGPSAAAFDWPLLVKLSGKGKPEVVVPFGDYAANAGGVEVLDAATGKSRWRRRLSGATRNWGAARPDRIVVGPDLDGDGYRELFVASREEETRCVYIDALSGSDGHSLWTVMQPKSTEPFGPSLLPLRWWQTGPDGWPLLIVSQAPDQFQREKSWSLILAASTGRIAHLLTDFGSPEIADFNGDGLPGLFGRHADNPGRPVNSAAGKIRAIKAAPPDAWRMLSNENLVAVHDVNDDGFADLLDPMGLLAVSGRDGSTLWRNEFDNWIHGVGASSSASEADLDGDGAPDILYAGSRTAGYATVVATSGRNGRQLWSTEFPLETHNSALAVNGVLPHLAGHILDASGKPDVLLLFSQPTGSSMDQSKQEMCLVRLSGRDGRLLWQQSVCKPDNLFTAATSIPFATADLTGSGVKDIIFWAPLSDAEARALVPEQAAATVNNSTRQPLPLFELRAYHGSDGKLLWRRPSFFSMHLPTSQVGQLGQIPQPLVADLEANGKPDILITDVLLRQPGEEAYAEVLALDGRTGNVKWSWRGDSGQSLDNYGEWAHASPQVVRTAAGPAIAVSIYDQGLAQLTDPKTHIANPTGKSANQIVLLNPRGEVLRRVEIAIPFTEFGHRPRLWVGDLAGDGRDELVWGERTRICAMRTDGDKRLWEWAYPDADIQGNSNPEIQGIQPACKGYPATVAVGLADGFVGLAGPTGKMRWRCGEPDTVRWSGSLLATGDPQGVPRIWTVGPGAQRSCRLALPTDTAGKYLPPVPTRIAYDQPTRDPRLLRPLPWARTDSPVRLLRRLPWARTDSSVVLIGLVGLLVGGLLIALAIGRRPGSLGRAAWLLAFWLVGSLLGGLVWLWIDAKNMAVGEHYDWDGWFAVFVHGFVVVMWGLLVALPVAGLLRLARWAIRRRAATRSPK